MLQKIGFGAIEWSGFKQVLVHTLLVGLAAIAAYLIFLIQGHNFGTYEALVTVGMTFVVSFCNKFFGNYNITLPAGSTQQG